jgi:glycosidase
MPFTKLEIILGFNDRHRANYSSKNLPKFEFHIARQIREKYNFEEELFTITGNVILADFRAVRDFTNKINQKREDQHKVRAGHVNATGLLDEIYHFILREYELTHNPGVFQRAVKYLSDNLGIKKFRFILNEFVDLFPPLEVYRNKISTADYISGSTEGKPNIEIIVEEMMLLYYANLNPANKGLRELFSDEYFTNRVVYGKSLINLDKFFKNEKPFGPDNHDIFTLLRTPIETSPEDIEGQLDFVQKKWGVILKDKFSKRILTGKDLIKEDRRFDTSGGGDVPTVVPRYKGLTDDLMALGKSGYNYAADSYLDYLENEQFTPDIHWMPNVILMAKNTYVWLDQLSKKYGRHIHKLDHIPDEELDEIAGQNINGLWLIGLWERSNASSRIKQIMGNPEAISSAYSLWDYEVAYDLGGEPAFNNLKERAWARGIRLASDMVPNHTGIYSRWMLEKPHYFIQSNYSPFPNYQFTGVDLSENHDMQIRIEDGYWRHSDAAVVLQRIDNRSGEVRYIYHGNDGTNMPWNDTAQLNLLMEEVREAVIQKIFDVARKTSIIRFDAAMTLAKKHFQRLWYPQPGTGGDIPSRADHALTRQEFDRWFPKEFWREVVDRINEEMPETLLLAEAFWLMEGYFVRSLGMHRVYNSAFMHMLMNEENSKYRDLITNTLEFEPEILKRYVNFMSNPDEETAIKQFGTEDKYFGTCMLMVTLPGLPMLAHGQIEGYTEKYGIEYKRAYYN